MCSWKKRRFRTRVEKDDPCRRWTIPYGSHRLACSLVGAAGKPASRNSHAGTSPRPEAPDFGWTKDLSICVDGADIHQFHLAAALSGENHCIHFFQLSDLESNIVGRSNTNSVKVATERTLHRDAPFRTATTTLTFTTHGSHRLCRSPAGAAGKPASRNSFAGTSPRPPTPAFGCTCRLSLGFDGADIHRFRIAAAASRPPFARSPPSICQASRCQVLLRCSG